MAGSRGQADTELQRRVLRTQWGIQFCSWVFLRAPSRAIARLCYPCPPCAAEESREAWNKSARLGILSEGYKLFLRDLSTQIKGIRDGPGKEQGGIQFVNLSPAWRDQNVYSYFNNSGEMPREGVGGKTVSVSDGPATDVRNRYA